MSIPDYQSLMLPVLVASSKGEVRIRAVVDQLAEQLGLSPEECNELLSSGKQTVFSNRVNWAKSYLNKANLVEITQRGHFKITKRGEEVIKSNPSHIDNRFLMQFEEFRQFKEKSNETAEQDSHAVIPELEDQKQTPDEVMWMAHRQSWKTKPSRLRQRRDVFHAPAKPQAPGGFPWGTCKAQRSGVEAVKVFRAPVVSQDQSTTMKRR